MSGKFLTFLLVFLSFNYFFSFTNSSTIYINGYALTNVDRNILYGLRYKSIADLNYKQGKYFQAVEYYEKALKYIQDEADIYYYLGVIYYNEKLFKMALEYLKKAFHLYEAPQNLGKTQRNKYMCAIYFGLATKLISDSSKYKKEAIQMDNFLADYSSEIKKLFPDVYNYYEEYKKIMHKGFDTIKLN